MNGIKDKKLLWRANLYVQEKADDWNDLHPWNAPLSENAWNKNPDGSKGDGGQVISIPMVTSPILAAVPTTAVTYDYPETPSGEGDWQSRSVDTPFDYVTKIGALKAAMGPYFDASGNPLVAMNGNYSKSTAPKDVWRNYWDVALNKKVAAPGVGLLWGYIKPADGVVFTPQDGLDVRTINMLRGTSPYNDPKWTGVDCIGLAKNAAAYGTNYVWVTKAGAWRTYPAKVDGVVQITGIKIDLDQDVRTAKLKLVVPGDVMWYDTSHIAIVLSNTGTGLPSGIRLIESTHSGKIASATNGFTLSSYASKDWIIGRLK